MNSFYGGPQGASFKISKVFNSVYNNADKTSDCLKADLQKRWQSEIGVDEYVMVSYGIPNYVTTDIADDDEYKKFCDIDFNGDGKNYNGTLWQKVYIESEQMETFTGEDVPQINNEQEYDKIIFADAVRNGWGYKLIGSFAGQTPYFTQENKIIEANEQQSVELSFANDGKSIDRPKLTFYEPKSWQFTDNLQTDLEASQDATMDFYGVDRNGNEIKNFDDPHSTKHLEIHLPKPWQFGFTKRTLKANQNPVTDFYGVAGDTPTINNDASTKPFLTNDDHSIKHLDLQLPEAWQFTKSINTDLKASQPMTVDFYGVDDKDKQVNDADPHSIKKLEVHVPQPWQFNLTKTNVNAATEPSVELSRLDEDENGNYSQLQFQFKLPLAWKIEKSEDVILKANQNPSIALNTNTESSTKTLAFSMPAAWDFNVDSTAINPIKQLDNNQIDYNEPTVSIEGGKYQPDGTWVQDTNNEGHSTKLLKFNLPKPLQINATYEPVTNIANAGLVKSYSEDTLDLKFKIYNGQDGRNFKVIHSLSCSAADLTWFQFWSEPSGDIADEPTGFNDGAYFNRYEDVDESGMIAVNYTNIIDNQEYITSAWVYRKNDGWWYSLFSGNNSSEIVINDPNKFTNKTTQTYSAELLETELSSLNGRLDLTNEKLLDLNNYTEKRIIHLNEAVIELEENKANKYDVSVALNNKVDSSRIIDNFNDIASDVIKTSLWTGELIQNNTDTTIASYIVDTQTDSSSTKTWTVNAIKSHVDNRLNNFNNISFSDDNDGNVTISFVTGGTN